MSFLWGFAAESAEAPGLRQVEQPQGREAGAGREQPWTRVGIAALPPASWVRANGFPARCPGPLWVSGA